jgi:hypothetical protein
MVATVSGGLVNVNNLTVTGTQAGAVTATNVTVENLSATNVQATNVGLNNNLALTGNLTVDGKLTASLHDLIEYQNLCWRQQFDVSEVYTQLFESSFLSSYATDVNYPVRQYVGITENVIQDDSGNPTTLLTEATPASNPYVTDSYGNPAPLIKINDNGSLSYLDASMNITDICKELIPENLKTYKSLINAQTPTFETQVASDTGVMGLPDNSSAVTQMMAWRIKRGFPMGDNMGVNNTNNAHIFYNNMLAPNTYNPQISTANVSMGLDINPWLDGSGSMDFYIQGGIQRPVPLGVPTVDWTDPQTVIIPPFPVQVTTDSVEYTKKKANNENSVYLNTKLNVLNFNIVDFGDYVSYFPSGYENIDTSNSTLDSSNSIVISPVSFVGSFGFFRNLVESTNNGTNSLQYLNDPNMTYTQYNYRTPVQSSLAAAEFVCQVSDTMEFNFNISTKEDLQIVSISLFTPVTDAYNAIPIDICTAFALPRYEYGVDANHIAITVNHAADEILSMPYTRGEKVGQNRNTPYLTEVNACGAKHDMYSGTFAPINFTDLSKGPDNQQELSADSLVYGTWSSQWNVFMHEESHCMYWAVGINSKDFENNIVDDEYMGSVFGYASSVLGMFPDSSGGSVYIADVIAGIGKQPLISSYLSRGTLIPFAQTHDDSFFPLSAGTDFPHKIGQDIGVNGLYYSMYPLAQFSIRIGLAFDPNMQHFKLFIYYMAKKLSHAKNYDILRMYYKDPNNTQGDQPYVRGINPAVVIGPMKQALEGAQMHDGSGNLMTDGPQIYMNSLIMTYILRNNACIPSVYRDKAIFDWYSSTHAPEPYWNNQNYLLGNPFWISPTLNMAAWDFNQTNEDSVGTPLGPDIFAQPNMFYSTPVVPWWPKVINPPGPDAQGQYLNMFDPSGNMTQDTTYKGICTSPAAYVESIDRNLYTFGTFTYALTNELNSVTVQLTEPFDTSGTYDDGYNTNIAVAVFKYIPECCQTGVRSDKGAFIMKGPYTLSKTGTTSVTIGLSGAFVNNPGSKYTVSKDTASLTAPMMDFNYVFPHGVDGSGSIYLASDWAKTRGVSLGMTGNVNDVYQPVTKLIVVNKHVGDVEFDDADILDKLFFSQIKPSAVTVSVS